MPGHPTTVDIDVSKNHLDVARGRQQQHYRCLATTRVQTPTGGSNLRGRTKKLRPRSVSHLSVWSLAKPTRTWSYGPSGGPKSGSGIPT